MLGEILTEGLSGMTLQQTYWDILTNPKKCGIITKNKQINITIG